MKTVRGLASRPDGLARFHADTIEKDWLSFCDFEGGSAKKELTEALSRAQRGLCAYCEIRLHPDESQIDHVVPKGGPDKDEARATDETNMLACCKGGTDRNFADDTKWADPTRFKPPVEDNMSCGSRKGERLTLDPRSLTALPPLYRVNQDGQIEVVANNCVLTGISTSYAEKAIQDLGLRAERLRQARKEVWDVLLNYPDDPELLLQVAESELALDGDGKLAPFFTTRRSFFRELAEAILARPPQSWIGA